MWYFVAREKILLPFLLLNKKKIRVVSLPTSIFRSDPIADRSEAVSITIMKCSDSFLKI